MEIDRDGLEVLPRAECLRLLAGNDVGRIVVSRRVLPAAFPVRFALLGGDVVFLAATGGELDAATAGQVVAFQADATDRSDGSGWSVLLQGRADVVDDPGAAATARGLSLGPWASTASAHVVRVRAEIVSGRRIVPNHPACDFRPGPHGTFAPGRDASRSRCSA